MAGWIKLHRKLTDNPLWFCEKFTRGQAWIDLLLLANFEDSFFYKRGVKIDVKRGQVGRSEVELSDRWKWSRSKVRKFLNDLEKEQQIEQQKTNVTQLITIVNYDFYQEKEQQIEQQKDSKRTAKEQQKDTLKEEKESKEEKEINNNKFNFKKSFLDLGVDKQILDDWMQVRKNKKATNTKTAFTKFITQVNLSGLTVEQCVKICAENDWKGFEAKWLENLKHKRNGNSKTQEATSYEELRDILSKHFD